eukprot:4083822-Amphidinium_carterae.1
MISNLNFVISYYNRLRLDESCKLRDPRSCNDILRWTRTALKKTRTLTTTTLNLEKNRNLFYDPQKQHRQGKLRQHQQHRFQLASPTSTS